MQRFWTTTQFSPLSPHIPLKTASFFSLRRFFHHFFWHFLITSFFLNSLPAKRMRVNWRKWVFAINFAFTKTTHKSRIRNAMHMPKIFYYSHHSNKFFPQIRKFVNNLFNLKAIFYALKMHAWGNNALVSSISVLIF